MSLIIEIVRSIIWLPYDVVLLSDSPPYQLAENLENDDFSRNENIIWCFGVWCFGVWCLSQIIERFYYLTPPYQLAKNLEKWWFFKTSYRQVKFQTFTKWQFLCNFQKKVAIRSQMCRTALIRSALEMFNAVVFEKTKFQNFRNFFCAKCSLRFSVRSVIFPYFCI